MLMVAIFKRLNVKLHNFVTHTKIVSSSIKHSPNFDISIYFGVIQCSEKSGLANHFWII